MLSPALMLHREKLIQPPNLLRSKLLGCAEARHALLLFGDADSEGTSQEVKSLAIQSPRRRGATSVGGRFMPSAFAVLRLITSSYPWAPAQVSQQASRL